MTSLFNESGNDSTVQGKETVRRIHLISSSNESKQRLDSEGRDNWLSQFADSPLSRLPTTGIDEVTTQVELHAVDNSSPLSGFSTVDGLPYDKVATQITPERPIPVLNEVPKLETLKPGVEGYASQIRVLVKSSGIYAIASMASPLISLVLMPFLTHTLSHSEYGALAVLNTVIALVAGITQLSLGNAFFRAYSCDYESQRDRLKVVSTVVILLSLISIPIIITAMMTAPWLANLLFKSSSYSSAVVLAALIVLMQNLTVPGLSWLRVENRAAIYSALVIANLLVYLSAALIFVGIFHMGITGALLAMGGGYAVVVICTLPVVLIRARLHFRVDIARNLLSFGLPLVSNFVSVWILQLSDRYLLSHFGSLSQTASYAVAYSLGGVLSVVILAPFTLAWPSAMFAIAKRDDAPRIYQLVFRWYGIVLLFATFALSLASTIVFDLFFPPAYHSAAPVIPIVALSIMFYAVYNIFTTGISIKRKTWFAVVFTTVAAFINVGFNIALIPLYGSMGAAWSTLLAYTILTVIAYIVNQRMYPIPYEIGTFVFALVIGIGLYTCSNFVAQKQGTYVVWGISLGALVLYGGCLLLLGMLLVRKTRNNSGQV